MEDLLALRAGEASVWARRHSETCAVCRAELEALYQRVAQLKALPALRPARDRWPAVRDALRAAKRQRQRRVAGGWGALAAAAGLTALLFARPVGQADSSPLADLNDIKERSASLEVALGRGELGNRVMSGLEAALAAELEDRIAVIDGELVQRGAPGSPATDVVDLWRRRVDLMERLYTVRRAAYQGM
jgi:hypothetical protein